MNQPKTTFSRHFRNFLGYTFRLEIAKSLQPFADFYYNIGRMLVGVFLSIKLIDRTHPWARAGSFPRPLEVLAYVCARADWTKPWKPETVLVGSITMLVGLGSFAATSMTLAAMIGASEAYASSMFTAINPATDLALKYMSNGFGVPLTGVPVATVDGVVEGFQKVMALYSMAMLVIAGFILLYIITAAIAATAHEGRLGGGSFNQVWAPIRMVVAIGLLVPLPMVAGFNGYNSGQYIVMKLAEFGSGLATNLWVPFATSLANKSDVIATPSVEPAAASVLGVLRNEFCRARYNLINSGLALGQPAVNIQPVTHGGIVTQYYTTDADTTNAFCGATRYEKAINAGTLAVAVANGYETAYNAMRIKAENLAANLNANGYIELYSDTPGQGNETQIKQMFTTQFVSIVTDYQNDLANVLNGTMTAQNTVANTEMTTQIQDAGWAGASLWFNAVARINGEIMSAARALPSSSLPELKVSGSGTATYDSSLLNMMNEGVKKFNEFADNLSALIPAYVGSSTAGQGTIAGTINTSSVTTGLATQDAGLADQGSQMIGTILKSIFSTSFGGPFGQIGQGAEAALSQINPLAELASIGDWMINKSMLILALAAGTSLIPVMPMVVTMFLFLIATTGFGAGVMLFYVLPLMPFIRSMFGVVGWLLNVLEAIVAIPLIAVAHLSTKGEGISGDLSRTSYFMIFSIFLRPALLIVGLIAAMMMFTLSIGILNDMYKAAILGFRGTGTGEAGGGLSVVIYTVLYCVIAYMLCNLCFKLIEDIPNKALTWIGQSAAREITQDEGVARVMAGQSDIFFGGTSGAMQKIGSVGSAGGTKLPAPKPAMPRR